ncbi:MAG: serine hydrolase [Bacteroidales bacterium]|nr:serine hydrolase [Bacteroidales bacterium]
MKAKILTLIALVAAVMLAGCGRTTNNNLPRQKAADAQAEAFDKWFAAEAEAGQTIHSAMVVQHGKVILERWIEPNAPDSAHVMHSVSKTFTSMAIGFAIDEGLIKLDDHLVDFFPYKLPGQVSDNLRAITVRDLLTMSCGHEREHTDEIRPDKTDWVREFLSFPVEREPGTYFCYNTIGTYMLSAIITKVTGEKMVDYLQPRLWEPLGIEKPRWLECPMGVNYGGWGLYIKTEDMAKLGQTLLCGGKWQGKQVIPAGWVAEATKAQIDNRPADFDPENDPNPDWHQGYCYQMWRCRHNAFRADGAYGQYIIVMPDQDAVIAITADVANMQTELNLVWDYLLPVL